MLRASTPPAAENSPAAISSPSYTVRAWTAAEKGNSVEVIPDPSARHSKPSHAAMLLANVSPAIVKITPTTSNAPPGPGPSGSHDMVTSMGAARSSPEDTPGNPPPEIQRPLHCAGPTDVVETMAVTRA